MAKCVSFFLALFIFKNNITAQLSISSFTLEGKINIDTGIIKLVPVGDDIFYPNNSGYHETKILKGKFTFTDSILNPYGFRLRLDIDSIRGYMSETFIIDPGAQTIVCNIDSSWAVPTVTNNSMKEFRSEFVTAFEPLEEEYYNFDKKKDSLYSIYKNKIADSFFVEFSNEKKVLTNKGNVILLEYTKYHPNSFVALWTLINKLSSGYETIFDSIYTKFSDSIKNTYSGKMLSYKLGTARITAIGNIFPSLLLLTTKNKKVQIPAIINNNRYLLVDFWFSHCNPCISQFKELKNIFETYNKKGFNIIGISTDSKEFVPDWKRIIIEHQLPWYQYLDLNRKEADKLSIDKFPTNFLLDSQGKILLKDLSPWQLKKILEQKLGL